MLDFKTKEFWFNDNWCAYISFSGFKNFKLGFTLGIETCIYLGFVCFGIDRYY
jgi:hypothetical protein